jgi:hypothetical protein
MQLQVTCTIGDKPTRSQRILLLLQDFPEIRNSYDLIIAKYFSTYRDEKVKFATLERDIRIVQYDLGIFPPSERVRKLRKETQQKIIEANRGFFSKLWRLLTA